MVSKAASYPTKPRSASCFGAPLYQTVKGRPCIAVYLVVFGFKIDDNEFPSVFLNLDLGPDDTLEDLISPLGTLGLILRHRIYSS